MNANTDATVKWIMSDKNHKAVWFANARDAITAEAKRERALDVLQMDLINNLYHDRDTTAGSLAADLARKGMDMVVWRTVARMLIDAVNSQTCE